MVSVWGVGLTFIDRLVHPELDFNGSVPACAAVAADAAARLVAARWAMPSLRLFQACRASLTAPIVSAVC